MNENQNQIFEKFNKIDKVLPRQIKKKKERRHIWPMLRIRDVTSPSHQASQIASSTRGQTAETRRTTILQPVEEKPHSQKDRQDEKAEGYIPDEGIRQNPRKTTKRSADRQPSRKRIQNNDSKDDPGPQNKNGGKDQEDARNV